MEQKLKYAVLEVEGIESDEKRIKIKSQGLTYSIFLRKNDGQETKAFQNYKELNVNIGKVFSFGFSEKTGTAQKGDPITYRNIAVISDAKGQKPTPRGWSDQATEKESEFVSKKFILELIKQNNLKMPTREVERAITPTQPQTPLESNPVAPSVIQDNNIDIPKFNKRMEEEEINYNEIPF